MEELPYCKGRYYLVDGEAMIFEPIKLRAGNRLLPAQLGIENNRYFFKFRFNRTLLNEIKNMSGATWHGYDPKPRKLWSVPINARNDFQLQYLVGGNPYEIYDRPLLDFDFKRPLYEHQKLGVSFFLTRHYAILAGEMGVGKSLTAIVAMEKSLKEDWWWVGPKSAIKSVELELDKWESRVIPRLLTYDKLKKVISDWQDGAPAPAGIVFDESARIKTPTAQRSQAAMHLADAIRREHGWNGYVWEMSGTPAPKSPVDWWNQAEIACPGFVAEGTYAKFKYSLCLIEQKEAMYGGNYPHLVTWWDDPDKCKICGQVADDLKHDLTDPECHDFQHSVNEIERLSKRLEGLVLVQFKKDCLDLPDKQYRIVECETPKSVMRVANAIANTVESTIKALTLLRELSDGFQYTKVASGKQTCTLCNGLKVVNVPDRERYKGGGIPADESKIIMEEIVCYQCNGIGEETTYERNTDQVKCPKDNALIGLLDEHSDIGRLVIYAGFTGSIDRICALCKEQGWAVLRIDGKSWCVTNSEGEILDDLDDALRAMDASHPKRQDLIDKYPHLVVVGHPASGSEGLTFTASPSIVYYSNDFNGMYRMQSEDRIHRAGMDTQRGATIIDILNLPTDLYVLNNLQKKKDLQGMSLGDIKRCLTTGERNEQDKQEV